MVVMAALINWVEMCWRATGDAGTVVKLGQCQTLQPRLSPFLSENTFFHTLTPFFSSSTRSAFLLLPVMHPLCLFFSPSIPSIPALLISIGLLGNSTVQVICSCKYVSQSKELVRGWKPTTSNAVLGAVLQTVRWNITH